MVSCGGDAFVICSSLGFQHDGIVCRDGADEETVAGLARLYKLAGERYLDGVIRFRKSYRGKSGMNLTRDCDTTGPAYLVI